MASPRATASGYDRVRVTVYDQGRRDNRRDPRVLRGYQDPAFARGYSDGWEHGADDRRDRDRYDPVRHGDYRDGDDGYSRSYGSKDAYKNNYRAGFRQGYEDGYRNGDALPPVNAAVSGLEQEDRGKI